MTTDPSDVNFLDPWAPIKFEGYVKSMRTNERDGEMILSVAVDPSWKFHALLTTDFPGTMFDLTFLRQNHEEADDDTAYEPAAEQTTTTPPRFEPWQTT